MSGDGSIFPSQVSSSRSTSPPIISTASVSTSSVSSMKEASSILSLSSSTSSFPSGGSPEDLSSLCASASASSGERNLTCGVSATTGSIFRNGACAASGRPRGPPRSRLVNRAAFRAHDRRAIEFKKLHIAIGAQTLRAELWLCHSFEIPAGDLEVSLQLALGDGSVNGPREAHRPPTAVMLPWPPRVT
jgi:hypothetical protein